MNWWYMCFEFWLWEEIGIIENILKMCSMTMLTNSNTDIIPAVNVL